MLCRVSLACFIFRLRSTTRSSDTPLLDLSVLYLLRIFFKPNFIQMSYPKAIVGAIIYNQQKEILLFKSAKWSGWVNPGGHIEWGETMEQALRREVKEETNLEVGKVALLATIDGIFKEGETIVKHYVFMDFACEFTGGEIQPNAELLSPQWFGKEAALELELMKEMREVIEIFYQRVESLI